jgi:hypothetical protein
MPVLELLAVILGSMCGSGGVVYLVVRAAISEQNAEIERRLQLEREWMDKTFVRKTA